MNIYDICHQMQTHWILVTLLLSETTNFLAAKTVSQCHRPQGFPFVSLYCGFKKVIQIQRAFHGSHKNPEISHCGYLDGDCTMDTTHMYDWSMCEGRYTCVQMIQTQDMDPCPAMDMLYLQVHYACIPGTAVTPAPSTLPPPPPPVLKKPPPRKLLPPGRGANRQTTQHQYREKQEPPMPVKPAPSPVSPILQDEAWNMCSNKTWDTTETTLVNPGYPNYYTTNTECRCLVKGPNNTKVQVTYQDMSLVMRGGQCVDWLLLQSLGFKNSAAVTCGQMGDQQKTLKAKGNWLLLHFHTAKGATDNQEEADVDNDSLTGSQTIRNMAGFKITVKTQPESEYHIQCYSTTSDVLQTLKYKDSQKDIMGNLILPRSNIDALAISESSCCCSEGSIVRCMVLLLLIYTGRWLVSTAQTV